MRSGKIPLRLLIATVLLVSIINSNRADGGGLQTEAATISGEVVFIGKPPGPIVIEVYARPQFAPRPVSSSVVEHSGPYRVQVHPGAYYLRAFVDSNQNRQWDFNEPIGTYPTEQALVIVPLASKGGINILIPFPKKSTEKQEKNH